MCGQLVSELTHSKTVVFLVIVFTYHNQFFFYRQETLIYQVTNFYRETLSWGSGIQILLSCGPCHWAHDLTQTCSLVAFETAALSLFYERSHKKFSCSIFEKLVIEVILSIILANKCCLFC